MTAPSRRRSASPAARISASASPYQAGASQRLTKPGPAISARSTSGSAAARSASSSAIARGGCLRDAREPQRDVRRVVAVRRVARALERDLGARRLAERGLEPRDRVCRRSSSRYRRAWRRSDQERQLNIQIDAEHLAGVYANFANISFSDYEFTITFARIDHEVEEGEIPGVVVARVNMSTEVRARSCSTRCRTPGRSTRPCGDPEPPRSPPRES